MFSVPTFYITNDVERALWPGWENDPNYYIVTYRNPYSEWLKQSRKSIKSKVHKVEKRGLVTNIFLVDGKKGSTEELMKHNQVIKFIKFIKFIKSESQKVRKSEKQEINIIVFKPTVEVEEYCKKMGWKILNPSSRFAEQFEEKIVQTALFQKLKLRIPKTIVTTIGALNAQAMNRIGFPFVLQFNLGHTGEGTYFIRHQSDVKPFQNKFPMRPVRVARFIKGVPLTVNAVVGKKVYISAPSLQITGVPELTALPFATVGNDWSWVSRNMEHGTWNMELRKIVIKIGNELKKKGYRGAFGVDLITESKSEKGKRKDTLYVIEVNVRQVNSCVYESELQGTGYRVQGIVGETTMGLYFKCLLGQDTGKEKLPSDLEGSQLFMRALKDGIWEKNIAPMSLRGSAKPASPDPSRQRQVEADGGQGGQSQSYARNQRLLRRQSPPRNDKSFYFLFSKLNKGDSVKKNAEILRIQSDGSMIEKPMKLSREVQQIIPL